jgi:hypothetical protein
MAGRHSAGKTKKIADSDVTGADTGAESVDASSKGAEKAAKPSRKAMFLRIGGTALALAVVILAVSLYAGAQRTAGPTLPPIISSVPTQSASATTTPSGTTTTSTTATSTTGTNTNGTGTGTGTGTGSTAATSGGVPAGIYASQIADLASVVPSTFLGYDMRSVAKDSAAVIVPLQPDADGPNDTVSLAVVSITDKSTAAKATAFVSGMSKAYSRNVMHAGAGSVTGIFGTDGTRLAAFRFARGRYVIEVVITAKTGSPATLKTEVLRLASLMPASQP